MGCNKFYYTVKDDDKHQNISKNMCSISSSQLMMDEIDIKKHLVFTSFPPFDKVYNKIRSPIALGTVPNNTIHSRVCTSPDSIDYSVLERITERLYLRNTLPISLDTRVLEELVEITDIKNSKYNTTEPIDPIVTEDPLDLGNIKEVKNMGRLTLLFYKFKEKIIEPLEASRIKFQQQHSKHSMVEHLLYHNYVDLNLDTCASQISALKYPIYEDLQDQPYYSLKRTTSKEYFSLHSSSPSFNDHISSLSATTTLFSNNTTTRSTNVLALIQRNEENLNNDDNNQQS